MTKKSEYYELHLLDDCGSEILLFKSKEKALQRAKEHTEESLIYGDCQPFSSNEEYIKNALEKEQCYYFILYTVIGSPFADEREENK
jgi:hypothetical protein